MMLVFTSYHAVEARTLVFATGVVNAKGYETQIQTSKGGNYTLHFGGGNLIGTFTEGIFQLNFNPVTCSAAPTSQVKITILSGTGIYAGAKGSMVGTSSGYVIGARGAGGVCLGEKVESKSDAVLINAVGKITLKP
jgi:hypothetical protein